MLKKRKERKVTRIDEWRWDRKREAWIGSRHKYSFVFSSCSNQYERLAVYHPRLEVEMRVLYWYDFMLAERCWGFLWSLWWWADFVGIRLLKSVTPPRRDDSVQLCVILSCFFGLVDETKQGRDGWSGRWWQRCVWCMYLFNNPCW